MARRIAILALVAALSGCGDDEQRTPNLDLTTPGPEIAALPVDRATGDPPKPPGGAGRELTEEERKRLQPPLERWARALSDGRTRAAAKLFRAPVVVFQGDLGQLGSDEEILAFHEALPCGADLETTRIDGRYVVGTFRLKTRPGARCVDTGEQIRIAFALDKGRFTDWWQIPAQSEARPAPSPGGSGTP